MVGDLYNVIYRDGRMCFQAPALETAGKTYVNLITGKAITPLSIEAMSRPQILFHEQQAAALRRKWGIG